MYVFLVGALYLVIVWRYGEPFWSSLGWTFPIPYAFLLLATGPALAVALSALGVLLRAPLDSSQIEVLIKSRASLAAIILFGVVLAPIFEEMLFRGFLLPLLVRSLGPVAGYFPDGRSVRAVAWRAESLGVAAGAADRNSGDRVWLSRAIRPDRPLSAF